jgi:hypothetical protein
LKCTFTFRAGVIEDVYHQARSGFTLKAVMLSISHPSKGSKRHSNG